MKFNASQVSRIHSHRAPRTMAPIAMSREQVADYAALAAIGVGFDHSYLRDLDKVLDSLGFGLDSNDVGVLPAPGNIQTVAAIPALVQFLQAWLPGFVRYITAARKADEFTGVTTIGAWEDEQVVQGMLEPTGNAVPYGDYTNIPLTSWNPNFEWRTVVRFEMGALIGLLEEARAARMRASSSGEKRGQAAVALEIQRNRVAFYGYNDGAGRTYGFLNDTSLPGYVSLPADGTGSSAAWANKSFLQITRDIRLGFAALQTQSMDTIDVEKTPITIGLPTAVGQYTTVTTDLGYSVREWLQKNYPNARIVTAPELNDANGGASAMYMYAEKVEDGSSDDSMTFLQAVPAKFMALGVEKRAKSYVEDYANATAGTLLKRPYAVWRATGL